MRHRDRNRQERTHAKTLVLKPHASKANKELLRVAAERRATEANARAKYHALRLQELSIYQKKSSEI